MHALYILSVWLHVIAAMTWVGGMVFLIVVVVPWLRQGDRAVGAAMLRATGMRFRTVGWVCFGLLVLTGLFNLWFRGVTPVDLVDQSWLRSSFGGIMTAKLALFALVLVNSAVHDFYIGPRATLEVETDPDSARARRLRKLASWFGRINAVLAAVVVLFAVMLLRGWP